MRTRWFKEASLGKTLREHPAPQFMREDWVCLNGKYDFEITSDKDKAPQDFSMSINVPFAPECELSGVGRTIYPHDYLWYRKRFTVDERFASKSVRLHFEAVDWQCLVFVNGKKAGEHKGGYDPFFFDITEFLIDGENELTVCVNDPTDKSFQPRGKQVVVPHGFWYTATSGIWQTVWLEAVDKTSFIESFRFTPDIDNSAVKVDVKTSDNSSVKMRVFFKDEEITQAVIDGSAVVKIENPMLWTPENPNLYDVTLEVIKDDTVTDTVRTYFGMRKFSISKSKTGYPVFCLNNIPYVHVGLLDQGYWPDGGMTAPSDEALIFDIQRCKELGFNMLRKHIKKEPMRWYYHCDRLGILVWQDMMSGAKELELIKAGGFPLFGIKLSDKKYKRFHRENKDERDEFESELDRLVECLYNCVSICCWVPFNEAWGQFDAKRIANELKQKDPSRFVDHASGWYDQGAGDVSSEHRYILRVYSPKRDNRVFALTEFGGYSRVVDEHTWDKTKSFGYVMYKDSEKLSSAFLSLHTKQIFPLLSKGLSATIYTQVSDVENEVNGIFTYDREVVKLDEKTVKDVNAQLKEIFNRKNVGD